jgi:hypothetical protein
MPSEPITASQIPNPASRGADLESADGQGPEIQHNSAPPTTERRRASVVLSFRTLSIEDQAEVRHGVEHRSQEPSDHGSNGPFENEENQSERPLRQLSFRTPLTPLAEERAYARLPKRHGTWPGHPGLNLEKRREGRPFPVGPSQAGPSLTRSSPERHSRPSSIATSAQSDQTPEWDPVLHIGINDQNGKKQWRILTLDTFSDANIVAQIVVNELGLQGQIQEYNGEDIEGLGGCVRPVGQVELTFSVVGGRKTIKATFVVLSDEHAEKFDAIASLRLVKKQKWLIPAKPGAFKAQLK